MSVDCLSPAFLARKVAEFIDLVKPTLLGFVGRPHAGTDISDEQALRIAIHEAGHYVAALAQGRCHEVVCAAIWPRAGKDYGYVRRDRGRHAATTATQQDLVEEMIIKLSGRAAEELFFGTDLISVGSSVDLKRANEIAEDMVCRYGFSESIGLLTLADDSARDPDVRVEMRKLLDAAYGEAKSIVQQNASALGDVAECLIRERHVSGEILRRVLEGHPPIRR